MTRTAPPKQRKIAIMGFRSVGKSSLTLQFVEGKFVDSYDPTIENTFTKSMKLRSQDYFIKLIDTAGQDEFAIVPSTYSMDIHGYILVYSITSIKSFDIVKSIYEKLTDMTGKTQIPVVLVGNKIDLFMERTVSTDDGKATAALWNAAFFEASAKQNQNVHEIFHEILVKVEKECGNLNDTSKCVLS